jgi:CheY-like chemotaxis protein
MTKDKRESEHKPTVLCVDDEPVGLMVRAKLLELSGFSVITGADGPTAVELFRSNDVDVVLLDYMMPNMHGGEVAQTLRTIDPKKPIIMLSAYLSLPEEVISSVDLCLVKGLPPEELVAAIRGVLGNGHTEGTM